MDFAAGIVRRAGGCWCWPGCDHRRARWGHPGAGLYPGVSSVCCNVLFVYTRQTSGINLGQRLSCSCSHLFGQLFGSKHRVERRNQEAFKHSKPPSLCPLFSDPHSVTSVAPLPFPTSAVHPKQNQEENFGWKYSVGHLQWKTVIGLGEKEVP